MKEATYYEKKIEICNKRVQEHIDGNLPSFCKQYFISISYTTTAQTRLAYVYDLESFFFYLKEKHNYFKEVSIKNIEPKMLEQVKEEDIEEYLVYLSRYEKNGKTRINAETGVKRKFAAVRKLFVYLQKNHYIEKNAAQIVDMPKIHEKSIIKMSGREIKKFLDVIEHGSESFTKRQQSYHEKTKLRDLAIATLLLGTGIRVSECVGLNVEDVDFNNNSIKIIRKGGNQTILYFNEEVRVAIIDYLNCRENIEANEGSEKALFLSLNNSRMSVQAIEKMIVKYAAVVTPLKKITPHKLRSTYGTQLYRASGDIYLVADVLGHKDVNTTRKHYAAIDDDRRKRAARLVKLR